MTNGNFEYYLIGKNNGVSIYEDDFNKFYYSIDNNELHEFLPYRVNNKKVERKGKTIILEDINDLSDILDSRCSPQFIELILLYIHNKLYDNIVNCWSRIFNIMKEELCPAPKKKSKKKERSVKIPYYYVRDIKDISTDEEIIYTNFYETDISGKKYIIDLYKTNKNNFYTRITDIDNNYKEISINDLKKKNTLQLTLDFFNI